MTLYTEASQLASLKARFRGHYPDDNFQFADGRTVGEVFAKIPDKPTRSEVVRLINSSWIDVQCDECKKWTLPIIQVGDEPDYESSTACLCLKCVNKALKAISRK